MRKLLQQFRGKYYHSVGPLLFIAVRTRVCEALGSRSPSSTMHGRKRAAPGTQPSSDHTAALAKKVATYRQLGGLAMKHVSEEDG